MAPLRGADQKLTSRSLSWISSPEEPEVGSNAREAAVPALMAVLRLRDTCNMQDCCRLVGRTRGVFITSLFTASFVSTALVAGGEAQGGLRARSNIIVCLAWAASALQFVHRCWNYHHEVLDAQRCCDREAFFSMCSFNMLNFKLPCTCLNTRLPVYSIHTNPKTRLRESGIRRPVQSRDATRRLTVYSHGQIIR